jgi:hypothetical protein
MLGGTGTSSRQDNGDVRTVVAETRRWADVMFDVGGSDGLWRSRLADRRRLGVQLLSHRYTSNQQSEHEFTRHH